MKLGKLEIGIHVILLILYFMGINVDWTSDWFDPSIRPKTPAPLSALFFPIFFYVNAFIIIPKYFHLKTWMQFLSFSFLLFIAPELIRSLLYCLPFNASCFEKQLFSRDSLLFGAPSVFFLALNGSFIYRLTKDWFENRSKIEALKEAQLDKKDTPAYENTELLDDEEAKQMTLALNHQLDVEQIYLNSNLSLKDLADLIGTSEKKLSYLLNQKMNTSFYELLNKYRVEKFISEIDNGAQEQLSLLGIAMNCGFQSKSSFYRAFKSQMGSSPSAYLKKRQNSNK